MNRKQITRQLGIILGGMLIIYVASVGPVWNWALNHTEEETAEEQMRTIRIVYGPIIFLCHSSKSINDCVVAYIKMWAMFTDRRG